MPHTGQLKHCKGDHHDPVRYIVRLAGRHGDTQIASMTPRTPLRTGFLLALAVIFTVGLTFATVELPRVVDQFLQHNVVTPGWDSHADGGTRLKTELFIAHYHVRLIGYVAFFLLIGLIAAGLSTKRTGLAALGAFGVMLPVFAQFAGVMFFLAGLGVLNVVWLPVLDISYEMQQWGLVINAPNDCLRWLLGFVGIHSIWPTTVFFIAAGILLFLLGVYAWLVARARGHGVADSWVYRISRHPQYLGWVLWTYGAYLLLQQMHYPRRSWGIGASLPWLLSTMVIIAVALVEEIHMRKRYGDTYEAYRRSAPFLIPIPHFLERLFAMPFRLFGKRRPERKREVVAVVALYTVLLMACSTFFYGGGLSGTLARLASAETRAAKMQGVVSDLRAATGYRPQYRVLMRLVAFGEPAVDPLLHLLAGDDLDLRVRAAEGLQQLRSKQAVPALCAALTSPDEGLRYRALEALGAIGSEQALPALLPLLDDPSIQIRVSTLHHVAALGAREVLHRAPAYLADTAAEWVRGSAVAALGTLGASEGVPLVAARLQDTSASVRREAAVALLRIGVPEGRAALERALKDDDWEVRIYVAEALKRLPT